MQAKYKYYLVVDGLRTEMNPQGVRSLQTIFDLNKDGRLSHDVSLSSPIILTGLDFKLYYAIENSKNRCGDTKIIIDKLCSGQYVPFLEGFLRPIDGYYDLNSCRIEIQITPIDPYYCFDYNAKREIDIFEALPYNERLKVHAVRGTIETYEVGPTNETDPYNEDINGGENPREKKWLLYRSEFWSDGNYNPRGAPVQTARYYYFAREVLTLPCSSDSPGPEWSIVEDNCPTNKKWARFPIRSNYRLLPTNFYDGRLGGQSDFIPPNPSTQVSAPIRFSSYGFGEDSTKFTYDVMGLAGVPSVFDNGILLSVLLPYFIGKFCGINVKSNFFQINPDSTFSDSYPDLPDDNRTINAVIFQKSDVKRLSAANNATKGITTLEILLESIIRMFNLQYRIENNQFLIEHVSYWNRTVGLDLTQAYYGEYMRGTDKYKYDKAKLPQFEEFYFMEQSNLDFKGLPIEYFGRCVSLEDGEKVKRIDVSNITTDVEYCLRNSESDSALVSDDGFVIMATTKEEDDEYYLLFLNPILDVYPRVNNALSWAHLQEAFFQHARPQKIGYMNKSFHEFFTTIPVRKQDTIKVPFCCGDELLLTDYVKTNLGNGIIEKAVLNHYTEKLELDLIYENPNQEAFCTPLVKFSFNKATSSHFYFDVELLDCAITHTVQIEVILPDGTVYLAEPVTTTCQSTIDLLLEGQPALYKFRARQICGEAISPWSDYINVQYVETIPCGQLPSVTYINRTQPNIFIFEFTEPLFSDSVDVEHTLPSGSIGSNSNVTVQQMGTKVRITYNITNSDNVQFIFPGLYRFRFRRRCNSVSTSLFGSYVNVTI